MTWLKAWLTALLCLLPAAAVGEAAHAVGGSNALVIGAVAIAGALGGVAAIVFINRARN